MALVEDDGLTFEAAAAEMEELLRSKFSQPLSELNADPGRILSHYKLDRALGEGLAVVTGEGRTTIMEGLILVEETNGEGALKKVDLDLEHTSEGFEPENPSWNRDRRDRERRGRIGWGIADRNPPARSRRQRRSPLWRTEHSSSLKSRKGPKAMSWYHRPLEGRALPIYTPSHQTYRRASPGRDELP